MTSRPRPRQPDGRARRWAGQHTRRRAEFVEAALSAIGIHGPDVSTERIARRAGVARTRIYKHFDGAADLQRAIVERVLELLTEELEPVWRPRGTPMEMISTAVQTHVRWLAEHTNLYRYLLRRSPTDTGPDLHTQLGEHLTRLFSAYLDALGVDRRQAQTAAFGVVGYVESATNRWLDDPSGLGRQELVEQLTGTVWAVLDHTLREGNVELDPHRPLPPPPDTARSTSGPQLPAQDLAGDGLG